VVVVECLPANCVRTRLSASHCRSDERKEINVRRRDFLIQAAGLGLTAGATMPRPGNAADGAVSVAFPIDVQTWDPLLRGTPIATAITRCVFDQPLELTPDLKFGPSVISSYRWLGTDGKTLEINIRDGIAFHNGDRLTSADFKFSFDDRVKESSATLLAAVWKTVDHIETPSPTRAIVHFNTPMVTAPVMFADIPAFIVPKAYYEKVGADGFAQKPIGSGPFRLVDYERNTRIVLETYDGYWRGPPKIKRLTFLIIRDPVTRAAAIQSGQVDITLNLQVREAERLGALPGLEKHLDPTTSVTYVQMVNKGPLQDKNVRLACHHAIDKPLLSKALFGGYATPVWLSAGPGMASYVPGFKIDYDPAKAAALLAQSGYGVGNPIAFKFYTTNGAFANDYDMARGLLQMWKQVGINADLQPLEAAQFAEFMRAGKFDGPVLKTFSPAAGDPATYAGYMLDPKSYLSLWKSDDVPPRLYPLLQEVDDDKRVKGFQDFEMWAVEQGYSIPMFLGLTTIVCKRSLNFIPQRTGILNPYTWSVPT
jgi:peptide/nickel transport system substrate-binding protein